MPPRNILFVGRRNDALTQIAEAFAGAHHQSSRIVALSAGLMPTRVSHWAVRVMAEVGIDITPQESKSLDAINAAMVDEVILVESELELPATLDGVRRCEWQIEAPQVASLPGDEILIQFRHARDQLRELVMSLA
jgi:protein-tyrosine-phosphatase